MVQALLRTGCAPDHAEHLASIVADNTLEGSSSHGVSRFPRLLKNIQDGMVDVHAKPTCERAFGALALWDGHLGLGPLVAEAAMQEAMALANVHGIASVGVRNTNHWMRPGYYGLMAARAGYIGICWSNTMPNMPAWGATDARLGNNPLVLAVPYRDAPILVDMAMSQFAYGKLEVAALEGKKLSIPGGYDENGLLTDDPRAILQTRRILPTGYWKGTALSMALDLIGCAMTLGNTVSAIAANGAAQEQGLTQVFIAIHYQALVDAKEAEALIESAIGYTLDSKRADPDQPIRYPGQNIPAIRARNLREGLPVHEAIWAQIEKFVECGRLE